MWVTGRKNTCGHVQEINDLCCVYFCNAMHVLPTWSQNWQGVSFSYKFGAINHSTIKWTAKNLSLIDKPLVLALAEVATMEPLNKGPNHMSIVERMSFLRGFTTMGIATFGTLRSVHYERLFQFLRGFFIWHRVNTMNFLVYTSTGNIHEQPFFQSENTRKYRNNK